MLLCSYLYVSLLWLLIMSKKKGLMAILSPAKTLDLSPLSPTVTAKMLPSVPNCDPKLTLQVARAMKERTRSELKRLLGVSEDIAIKAHEYWRDFELDTNIKAVTSKPCIYSFSGAAYQGLQINDNDSYNADAMQYLQNNLRIIDPLYGVLRPLDYIQPYRLEMATRGVFNDKTSRLADFWRDAVTRNLAEDLKEQDEQVLLNLASDEYAAAVDIGSLGENVVYIKVVFREQGRVIAVHAKRARGLMVRYLALNKINSLEEVKNFNLEGYALISAECDHSTLVFDRPKQEKRPALAKTEAPSTATKRTKR
jgi:cytoplasmic iron level regulating protein YaaA (DUF328/UPF0246 family)